MRWLLILNYCRYHKWILNDFKRLIIIKLIKKNWKILIENKITLFIKLFIHRPNWYECVGFSLLLRMQQTFLNNLMYYEKNK